MKPPHDALTVGGAVRFASAALQQDDPLDPSAAASERRDSARREASVLLEYATGWTQVQLLTSLDRPLPDTAAIAFLEAVERRRTGEPLQYITGTAWFYGRPFHVEPGCLIPRPETEVLVELASGWVQTYAPFAGVCDLGTGSGAIAVTVALECPHAHMLALELSPLATRIARNNAERLGASVLLHETDGIEWLQQGRGRAAGMQVLVSNPPYIPTAEIDHLNRDVRDFEPRVALSGGHDGLDYYRALSQLGNAAFATGPASLWLEVGMGQAASVLDLFARQERARWADWKFAAKPDLRGILRVVTGVRRG